MRMPDMRSSRTGPLLLLLVTVAAVLSIFSASGKAQPAKDRAPVTHAVVIKQMHFDPAQLNVSANAIVEWKNEDIFSHTVTADDRSFDSGLIAPGQSWKMTVKDAGTFLYHCRPHPNMRASLVVSSSVESPAQGGARLGASGTHSVSLKWVPPTLPQQIHPILVNFTAALIPLAFFSDLLGRIFRRQSLHNAAWWMVLYAAAITPLTVAAGWWWKHAAGPELPATLITVHQWLGSSAAVLFIVLAVWRWSIHKRNVPPSAAYLVLALIAVLALIYQGSLGGTLVFGS